MRVAVTGGTGFLGAHTVATLLADGHDVRMLVRTPGKLAAALRPLGVDPASVEVSPGDITDADSVLRALDGCDACLHAAAVVATRKRDMPEVERTNATGTRIVLDTAATLGHDPIVYVSSVSAVFPAAGGVLRADLPVTRPRSVYGRSKADGEKHARALQDDGAPVVIVYPGGIAGPHDAGLNATADAFARFMRVGAFPVVPTGGLLVVDVRDLAVLLARVTEPGLGPRRFMAGGNFLSWSEAYALCRSATRSRLRRVPMPGFAVRATGRALELAARVVPFDPPLDYESAYYMSRLQPSDDSAVHALGIEWRPAAETVHDLVTWLAAAGHITP